MVAITNPTDSQVLKEIFWVAWKSQSQYQYPWRWQVLSFQRSVGRQKKNLWETRARRQNKRLLWIEERYLRAVRLTVIRSQSPPAHIMMVLFTSLALQSQGRKPEPLLGRFRAANWSWKRQRNLGLAGREGKQDSPRIERIATGTESSQREQRDCNGNREIAMGTDRLQREQRDCNENREIATRTVRCPVRYFKIFESHHPVENRTGARCRRSAKTKSDNSCPAKQQKKLACKPVGVKFLPLGTKNKHLSFTWWRHSRTFRHKVERLQV